MAEIEKITSLDGTTYDIADATARSGLEAKQNTILHGTSAPDNSTGNNGDVYIQHN